MSAKESNDVWIPPHVLFESAADLDAAVEGLTDLAWAIRDESQSLGPDLTGKSLEQYSQVWLLSAQSLQEFDAARDAALKQSAAGDEAALSKTLADASERYNQLMDRMALLVLHLGQAASVRRHEAALAGFAARVPTEEAAAARSRIEPLLARYRDAADASLIQRLMKPDLQSPPQKMLDAELFAAFNRERSRLAGIAVAADAQRGIEPRSLVRTAACDPPHPSAMDGGTPSIDKASVTPPPYPDDARLFGFEGTVKLRAHVSELGCATKVELVGPIGYESLDSAALAWGSNLRFHPASLHGKPVPASYTFAATFRLSN